MAMRFRPNTALSATSPLRVLGNVDYRLARNVVVSEYRKGRSGRCVVSKKELTKLARPGKDLACYVVEVCPRCSWNHLSQAFSLTTKSKSS
jgi:hypothetical protein